MFLHITEQILVAGCDVHCLLQLLLTTDKISALSSCLFAAAYYSIFFCFEEMLVAVIPGCSQYACFERLLVAFLAALNMSALSSCLQ